MENIFRKLINIYKNHVFYISIASIIIITQLYLLNPHLYFGFSDVDWGYLLSYIIYSRNDINPISNFIYLFKQLGVYTHQAYYIGFVYELVGINFKLMNLSIHIFRILMIISVYPIFLLISGSVFVAIIGMILFSVSYPSVGTMYTVVTSSDYSAYFIMNIFLALYYLSIKNGKNIKILIISFLFFVLTLFLSTERLYPLVAVIMIIEGYLYLFRKVKRGEVVRRIFIYFGLILPVFIIKPTLFSDLYANNLRILVNNIIDGNWYHLLRPIVSLGSTIIPNSYFGWFGAVKVDNIYFYLNYIYKYHFFYYFVFSLISSIVIFKNKIKAFVLLIAMWGGASVLIYILISHKINAYDASNVITANMGVYMLAFMVVAFDEWRKTGERLMLSMILGIMIAFVFIVLTWISADFALNFTGTHRYLTIPGMGIAFAQASVIGLFCKRIYGDNIVRKILSLLPILIIIPIVYMGVSEIRLFFKYHLDHGFGAKDQIMMRSQFMGTINRISKDEPSLFYFDYTSDLRNGSYYDATILGGFSTWMMFTEPISFKGQLQPVLLFEPPGGYKLLTNSIIKDNGNVYINAYERKIRLDNVYAFRLKDKKVYEYTDQFKDDIVINLHQ